jgi:hypothetical protein
MHDTLVGVYARLPTSDHRELAINAAALGASRNALLIAAVKMLNAKLDAGLAATDAIAAVQAAQPPRGRPVGTTKPKGG